MKKKFLPILLGSDENVYGMARSFYELYNVKSLAVCKKTDRESVIDYSNIILKKPFDNIQDQAIFLESLLTIYKGYKEDFESLILIPCGDEYAKLVVQNKKFLSKYFSISSLDEDKRKKIEDKVGFYKTCDKYNLDFPTTQILSFEDREKINFELNFPIMVKAADSISYSKIDFPGKKKAYKVDNQKQLEIVIYEIYSSEYRDKLILQEYIPGDDSHAYVLNTYSNRNKKVKMMSLGHVLLQNPFPTEIGNYTAIIADENKELYSKMKSFLEDFGYVGYANFDMKYDPRDKKYKLLEINVRQGRSSFYVTGAGLNLAKYIVEDIILEKDTEIEYNENQWLWHTIPKIILMRKINRKWKSITEKLILRMKCGSTIYYKEDMNFERFKLVTKFKFITYKNFKKYYKNTK